MAADVDANLRREYEAHKGCTPEELTEYLRTLTPREREKYQEYAAKIEREERKKEQIKKAEAQNRMGCIIAALVFVVFVGIMAYFQETEDSGPAAPAMNETHEANANDAKQSSSTVAAGNEAGNNDNKPSDAQINELKQAEFSQWNSATEKRIEAVEAEWNILWDDVLIAVSKDKNEKIKLRQNVENYEQKLAKTKLALEKTETYQHLTKEEQDKLKTANDGYILWLNERQNACGEIKQIIDKDLTPEKLQEIEAAIQKSNANMKTLRSRIRELQKAFGFIAD